MKTLPWVISVLLATLLIYIISNPKDTEERVEVIRLTYTDTVIHTQVQLVDSVVLKYKTIYLTSNKRNELEDSVGLDNLKKDTFQAEIPISQKIYKDSLYKVWISGYEANLDSIEVYRKKETEIITHTVKKKEKKWAVGPQIGVGMCGNKLQPYIGIGITYNIW